MSDGYKRSIIKTITWRFIGVCLTVLFLFIATGNINISLTIGAIDAIIKTIAYFLHERVWNKIKWGKIC